MNKEKFSKFVGETIDRCVATLCVKAAEYATEDRLHNFKIAAELQGCTPITALAGMMAKHTVSVYDLVQRQEDGNVVPDELWREKIGDSINYLLLLSALVEEKKENEINFREADIMNNFELDCEKKLLYDFGSLTEEGQQFIIKALSAAKLKYSSAAREAEA